jgi:hypothetical protein
VTNEEDNSDQQQTTNDGKLPMLYALFDDTHRNKATAINSPSKWQMNLVWLYVVF